MDTLRNMRMFVTVVEADGFSAAANQLAMSTGVVSRSITLLEDHLRTRLLNRTTRRIALTEAGKRYLARCRGILASVVEAEMEASSAHAEPVGTLRVHAMSTIGQHYVVPAIAAYQERYPAVVVDLTLTQGVPNIVEECYDVAITLSRDSLPDSNFISQKLGVIHSVLCAAPRYLEARSEPAAVEDLADHVCLQLTQPGFSSDRWLLTGPDGEREFRLATGPFKVNMPDAMAVALHQGMGIGALPTLAMRSSLQTGSLVRVLPDYHLQKLNVYAVYASRLYLDAKIRTWIEFAREWIAGALRAEGMGNADNLDAGFKRRFTHSPPCTRDATDLMLQVRP